MKKVMHHIPFFPGIVLLMSLGLVVGNENPVTPVEQKVNTEKECYLTNGDCSLNSLDTSTFIYPGGDTRCIAEDSEYRFEVSKGSNGFEKTKVLLYFQGGGACFNCETTDMCRTQPRIHSIAGVFDRKNVDNPYKDWTIVHVLYCSGDVHSGNKTLDYIADGNENSTNHFGFKNTNSVFNWMAAQNFQLDDLVVMGCSAGSLGAQMHADSILTKFKPKNALFVLDSYVGIFPKSDAAQLFFLYGSCETTLYDWSPSLKQKCIDKTITIPHVLEETIAKHADVRFASLNSRADYVQRRFADLMGHWFGKESESTNLRHAKESELSSESFEEGLIDTLSPLLRKYPNFKTYTVPGDGHCFTDLTSLYTTNHGALGLEGLEKRNIAENLGERLVNWLKELGDFSVESKEEEIPRSP